MLSTFAPPNTIVVSPPPIDGITIGAMTSLQTLADDITINTLYTALAELARTIETSSEDMFSSWTELLTVKSQTSTALLTAIALFDGVFELAGTGGEHTLPASDWCLSTFALAPIMSVTLPSFWGASAYEHNRDPAYPNIQLSVVILLEWTFDDYISHAQIVLVGVQDAPLRMRHIETALIGAFLNSSAIVTALNVAAQDFAVRTEGKDNSTQLLKLSTDLISQALHRFK